MDQDHDKELSDMRGQRDAALNTVDMLTAEVAELRATEEAIRQDERRRLAKLLRENSVTIDRFVKGGSTPLIALLLELGTMPPEPAETPADA